jgi:predicted DNA-binding transcriptional regulator YafY
LSTLAAVTLCAKRALHINYLSLQSGPTRREIVPVALADDGLRWHVRAFDRSKERFGDFVLTRITKFRELTAKVGDCELLVADEQWARILELELVPHPGITWSKAIEADYGMQDGVVRVKVRATWPATYCAAGLLIPRLITLSTPPPITYG